MLFLPFYRQGTDVRDGFVFNGKYRQRKLVILVIDINEVYLFTSGHLVFVFLK